MSRANDLPSVREGSDQPIDITSKKVSARPTAGGREVRFDGNVRVEQGDMTLTCDRLVTLFDEQKKVGERASGKKLPKALETTSTLKSITAIGNVTLAQEGMKAVAGQTVFDNDRRTITLTERPRVQKGPDTLEAHTIIIYLDESSSEALCKDGRPIRVTINPGDYKKDKER